VLGLLDGVCWADGGVRVYVWSSNGEGFLRGVGFSLRYVCGIIRLVFCFLLL